MIKYVYLPKATGGLYYFSSFIHSIVHSLIWSFTLKGVNEKSDGITYYSLVFYSGVCMGVSVGPGAAVVAVYSPCDIVHVNGRC